MPGLTDNSIKRISRVVRQVERNMPGASGQRKYPLFAPAGETVFRLDGDLVFVSMVNAIRQEWNGTSWVDATTTPTTVHVDFNTGFFFRDEFVLARRVVGQWQVTSVGKDSTLATLNARLIQGESASGTVGSLTAQTIRADYSLDYYFAGMTVFVIPRNDQGIWNVISPGFTSIRGVLDTDLASGGTATVSVYEQAGNGVWTDSGDDLTGVRPWTSTLNQTIPAGRKVLCFQSGPGAWSVTIEECASA